MSSPMLSWALPLAMLMLALAMALCLVRALRGPAAQDRVLALDGMYLSGMLLMLVLALHQGSILYLEAALVIALLGFVGTTALAKFLLRGEIIE